MDQLRNDGTMAHETNAERHAAQEAAAAFVDAVILDEPATERSVTRRSFLETAVIGAAGMAAAVGALHFTGAFARSGGITLAYADDAGNDYFSVYVLSREQIPVIAYDPANGANTPIEGMEITLTSAYNDKQVTATTDEAGCAVMNIKALCQEADDNPDAEGFAAYVRVDAECKGYRRFIELSHYVESGVHANAEGVMPNLLQVPSQPDNGDPYLSCVCLDGCDVQYLQDTLGLVAENDMEHTLTVQLENANAGDPWNLGLVSNTVTLGRVQVTPDKNGTAIGTIKGQWLDGSHGIAPGDVLRVQFNRVKSWWPIRQLILGLTPETTVLAVTDGWAEDRTISAGLESSTDDSTPDAEKEPESYAVLPSWLACVDDSFTLGLPFIPIKIYSDVKGNVGISATVLTWTPYSRKNGEGGVVDPKDRWKTFNSISNEWQKKMQDDVMESIENLLDAAIDDTEEDLKAFGASKVSTSLTAKFTAEVQAYGKLIKPDEPEEPDDPDEPVEPTDPWEWHADAAAKASLAVNYCMEQQLFVLGVPMMWGFDATGSVYGRFSIGCKFGPLFHNLKWGYEYGLSQAPVALVVDFRIEVGASVGLGVVGIATAGIRGYGFFDINMNTDTTHEKEIDDAPCPHIVIKLGAHFDLFIQALTFKKTVQVDDFPEKVIEDNWHKADDDDPDQVMAMPNSRFGEKVLALAGSEALNGDDMVMVAESELAGCVEFQGTIDDETGSVSAFTSTRTPLVYSLADADIFNPYLTCPKLAGEGPSGGLTSTSAALAAKNGLQLSTYNPLRGIRPTIQEKVWTDVYSNPREHVVTVNGTAYLLRIAMVEIVNPTNAENLQVVADKDGCLFMEPTAASTLQCATLNEEGTGLEYPQRDNGLTMATLIGYHEEADATEEDMRGLVSALSTPSPLGTPVNDAKVVRSRLTISTLNSHTGTWTDPTPIEFDLPTSSTEYLRVNSWDVDVDVVAGNDGNLYIALTSIVRPLDEEKSYDEQFKRQFVTLLQYKLATGVVSYAASSIGMLASKGEVFWNPHVACCDIEDEGQDATFVTMQYYYRQNPASKYCDLMDIALIFDSDGDYTYADYHTSMFLPNLAVEFALQDGDFTIRTISAQGGFRTCVSFLSWTGKPWTSEDQEEVDVATILWSFSHGGRMCGYSNTILWNVGNVAPGPMRVLANGNPCAAWYFTRPNDGSNGDERLLRSMVIETTTIAQDGWGVTEETATEYYPVGTTRDILRYFVSADGTRLYGARAMEGTCPAMPDDAIEAIHDGASFQGTYSPSNSAEAELGATEDQTVQQYQLMCAFLDVENGTFHEFFPMAELEFSPDSLQEIPLDNDRYDFIASTITDADNDLADFYHIAIPKVLGLQLEGAGSISKFAMTGDTCRYRVTLANTGNTPIGGFTAKLLQNDTQAAISTEVFDDLASAVLKSEDMLAPVYDDEGISTDTYEMIADARDTSGVLWPGKTRSYMGTFKMPAWAQDQLDIVANVLDPTEYKTPLTMGADALLSKGILLPENAGILNAGDDEEAEDPITTVDPRGRLFSAALPTELKGEADRIEASYGVGTGWTHGDATDGSWYYLDEKGQLVTSQWVKYRDHWYYLKVDGVMAASEWVMSKGKWYYMKANGRMAAGEWVKYKSNWYYLCADGRMGAGEWVKYKDSWYYLCADGRMGAGEWVKYASSWYYLKANGKMAAGEWLKYQGSWYYLKANGKMAASEWITDKGNRYYLQANGKMAAD